jgi:phosphatidylcholine synthase
MASNELAYSESEENWSPSQAQVAWAWATHLITASSAVWDFLALIAVTQQQWIAAWWWMALSVAIDSFDGLLARRVAVKKVLPQVDGALLDNIVDYLSYVLVPAFFLYFYGGLPPQVAVLGCALMLISSGYQFSQSDAKTEDHYFKGFPSYWNVVVLYMFLLNTNQWFNFAVIVLFSVLVFVPIKFIYPSRSTFQPVLMMVLSSLWGLAILAMIFLYPNYPSWLMLFSIAYVVYYMAASLWLTFRK